MKEMHLEMVPNCRNLMKGECDYRDGQCWFNHHSKGNEIETFENNESEDKIVMKNY